MSKAHKQVWADRAKRFLKVELKRADLTYEELATKLTEMGWDETPTSVNMKINRGAFPAAFFFAVCAAIGITAVALEDL